MHKVSVGRASPSSSLVRSAWVLVAASVVGSCLAEPPRRVPTVLFASGADLQSINPLVAVHPLARQVQKHVLFLTLAGYDSTYRPVPRLASWVWSPDRTELVLHVRRDVHWHDGVPTTAADVAWTLRAATESEMAYPRARDLAAVMSIDQLDSFTVRLGFVRPQPIFPDVLTDLAILPRHRLDGLTPSEVRTGAFNRQPVGNGPFAFAEYRPNQRWVFTRADDFPEELGRPNIERLVIVVVDEAITKLAALTSGELDFAGINPAHASFVRANPALDVVDYPVQFAVALVWNLRREPFDDVRVRRALTAALDRSLLVRAFLYGFGAVADGPVPPDHPWYEPVPAVAVDVEGAARQFEEMGWRVGRDGWRRKGSRPLEFELLSVSSGDNALEQMIQSQLAEVGVKVRLRQLELASFLEVVQGAARDFDAIVTGVPGDFSLGYVAAMFDGRRSGPLAYPGYVSREFDATLDAVRDATTEREVQVAWAAAQRVLAADLPATWIYHARGVQGVNRRVRGVTLDLRGELASVASWWILREGAGK